MYALAKKRPLTAILAWSCLPSEPAMGYLCTTQVLCVSAGKSWTSNSQKAVLLCLTIEGVSSQSPTWTFTHCVRQGQLAFASPVKVPTASPIDTKSSFSSWVGWSKFLAQGKNNSNGHNRASNMEPFDYQAYVIAT